jgi:pyrroline-5-carboxylate reductase
MASALARGLGQPALVSDVDRGRAEALASAIGGQAVESNAAAAREADAVVLCHKPPQLHDVAEEIRDHAKAVVSILGGVTTEAIAAEYPGTPVYRLMPSIPVEVGQGVVCFAAGPNAQDGPQDDVRELMGRVGTLIDVPEHLIDAATAVMSCAPAFYALVVEALVDGGVRHGLPAEMAGTMAVETLAGTATVLREGGNDTAELRRRVTSPGGMTERGLAALEEHGIRDAFDAAVTAVVQGR